MKNETKQFPSKVKYIYYSIGILHYSKSLQNRLKEVSNKTHEVQIAV